ncbi:MAG: DUF3107 domain-containing protein [Actinobacteria bacterium]|nr:DUF3107 domain-containing protein [Actinomycetota bacterium]
MDIKIGVTYTAKELDVELPDDSDRDQVLKDVEDALKNDGGVLWLTDKRGRTVGVPAAKVAYVEVGTVVRDRRVGFASA